VGVQCFFPPNAPIPFLGQHHKPFLWTAQCPPWPCSKPSSSCFGLDRSFCHAAVVVLRTARRCLLACRDVPFRPSRSVWFLLERLQRLRKSCLLASLGLALQVCCALVVVCLFARSRSTEPKCLLAPLFTWRPPAVFDLVFDDVMFTRVVVLQVPSARTGFEFNPLSACVASPLQLRQSCFTLCPLSMFPATTRIFAQFLLLLLLAPSLPSPSATHVHWQVRFGCFVGGVALCSAERFCTRSPPLFSLLSRLLVLTLLAPSWPPFFRFRTVTRLTGAKARGGVSAAWRGCGADAGRRGLARA